MIGSLAVFFLALYGYIPNYAVLDLVDERRMQAEARLAKIAAIEGKLPSALPSSPAWNMESLQDTTNVRPEATNTAMIHLEHLADAGGARQTLPPPPLVLCYTFDIRIPAALIWRQRWIDGSRIGLLHDSSTVAHDFDRLENLRYLLVLRQTEYDAPKFGAGGFVPGSFRGEALLVEVETGRYISGFEFRARNSKIVEKNVPAGESIGETDLVSDLRWNTIGAVKQQLSVALPQLAEKSDW